MPVVEVVDVTVVPDGGMAAVLAVHVVVSVVDRCGCGGS
jgi:phage terminase large subunit-like protein